MTPPPADDLADRDVEEVLRRTTERGQLTELDAYRLERFAWHELASTRSDDADRRRILRHLSEALHAAGRSQMAERCSDEVTRGVLDAWVEGEQEGRAAADRATATSPVTPPDVDTHALFPGLVWNRRRGLHESLAHRDVARTLSRAWESGELQPGRRGWRSHRQQLARDELTKPGHDERIGGTVLDSIIAERLNTWAARSRSGTATSLLTGVTGQLVHAVDPPQADESVLAPLRCLLEQARDGITLTEGRALPNPVKRRLIGRFGWGEAGDGPDAPLVTALHEMATRCELARRSGRRLVLTARGRHALSAPAALWTVAAASWLWGKDFTAHAGELALACLLKEGGAMSRPQLRMLVRQVMTELGWRTDEHRRGVAAEQVSRALEVLHRRGAIHGFLPIDPSETRLTDHGRRAAITTLRARVTGPRDWLP